MHHKILSQSSKSLTSKRYEEDTAPANEIIPDENIQDVDERSDLDLKEHTTKGAHLQSELDGELDSATRTIKMNKPEDADVLMLDQEVHDIITDYKTKPEPIDEVHDDLGILGDKHEQIQPVSKY